MHVLIDFKTFSPRLYVFSVFFHYLDMDMCAGGLFANKFIYSRNGYGAEKPFELPDARLAPFKQVTHAIIRTGARYDIH